MRTGLNQTAALVETLGLVAQAAEGSAGEWWIIGSAAVALHGGAVRHLKDVDLMMSAVDAERLIRRVGGVMGQARASDKFRSAVFGVWSDPPIPVEIFGGFSVATNGGWREVSLSTREAVTVGDAGLFVPSRDELEQLLREFGRPKDEERAKLLPR